MLQIVLGTYLFILKKFLFFETQIEVYIQHFYLLNLATRLPSTLHQQCIVFIQENRVRGTGIKVWNNLRNH